MSVGRIERRETAPAADLRPANAQHIVLVNRAEVEAARVRQGQT